jgi:hypothetical protein
MTRGVNTESADYVEGRDIANATLDTGSGANAREWLATMELAAELAHQQEDVGQYDFAHGYITVMREFLQEQGE